MSPPVLGPIPVFPVWGDPRLHKSAEHRAATDPMIIHDWSIRMLTHRGPHDRKPEGADSAVVRLGALHLHRYMSCPAPLRTHACADAVRGIMLKGDFWDVDFTRCCIVLVFSMFSLLHVYACACHYT